jgi:tRNA-binding protein
MESADSGLIESGNEPERGLSRQEFVLKPAPLKPLVTPQVLEQLDFRIGTIESVHDVPNSDKLVGLKVNFGDHARTILVGMKRERADPQEIVGKQALFVLNLPPRRMAGVLSEGMLLDIGYPDGICPVLLVPEKSVPNGTRAG